MSSESFDFYGHSNNLCPRHNGGICGTEKYKSGDKPDKYVSFYLELTKNCDVHYVFRKVLHLTANHAPNVARIIRAVLYLIDKLNITPNIWKSFRQFDEMNSGPEFRIVSAYCLIKSINTWLKTGLDFGTDSAVEFGTIYQPIRSNIKSECMAVIWTDLDFKTEIESFLINGPDKLSEIYKCNCLDNCSNCNPGSILVGWSLPFSPTLKDVIIILLSEITPTYWRDYLIQVVDTIRTTKDALPRIKVSKSINLLSLSESVIIKILKIFLIKKNSMENICNSMIRSFHKAGSCTNLDEKFDIFIDENYNVHTDLVTFLLHSRERIPKIHRVEVPYRCILCDRKPPKKMKVIYEHKTIYFDHCREKLDNRMQTCSRCLGIVLKHCENIPPNETKIPHTTNKIPLHRSGVMANLYAIHNPFGTVPIPPICERPPSFMDLQNLPKTSLDSFLKFRHHKIILIYCAKYDQNSYLNFFPADIITLIIKLMQKYRFGNIS